MVQGALKHLRNAVVLLLLLIAVGTIGFMFIEGWNVTDSLYMVIITITTTGFEEVHPLSGGGEIFTLFLVLVSFITIFCIGGIGIHILIESKIFRRRRMEKKLGS
ncbi:MAG: potassium channel family protein [Ignavibacteria bacterium]|nr:potassium channel family protein [Ignavibacteria bacterium]MBT8382843.1 potassium channel family protein [Ignavibacteria bacterium]MBT8393075.1 potassium channel family protein [Ignavibacteria bacterium]NNJ53582.1 two pore domain potassium channel family protein [Ignavibacteriaceae bacterium]NNL20189.1 two pore domain potassium channel family protein [Ignavibacteriaceae bacterium]